MRDDYQQEQDDYQQEFEQAIYDLQAAEEMEGWNRDRDDYAFMMLAEYADRCQVF